MAISFLPFERAQAFPGPTGRSCLARAETVTRPSAERVLIGRNLAADDALETAAPAVPDPSAQFAASRKLSIFLMSRPAIAPLACFGQA
jgi:hypothetical protein